jgi:two-component system sensor histidine kinase KdpD
MHGTIIAANRTDRTGAVFTIRLPVPAEPKQLDTAA